MTTVSVEQWGQMPKGVPKRMEATLPSAVLKKTREMESWLEENIGIAGNAKTGAGGAPVMLTGKAHNAAFSTVPP